jgi:rubrerythrin
MTGVQRTEGVGVIEQQRVVEGVEDDFVQFHPSGDRAKGAFRCTECGYGIAVSSSLPSCPMCGGDVWEDAEWSPFARARELL